MTDKELVDVFVGFNSITAEMSALRSTINADRDAAGRLGSKIGNNECKFKQLEAALVIYTEAFPDVFLGDMK